MPLDADPAYDALMITIDRDRWNDLRDRSRAIREAARESVATSRRLRAESGDLSRRVRHLLHNQK